MLKKIAVTGGIASGKTTACQFFQELGATVLFTDKIVHQLLEKDLKTILFETFGTTDRKHLSEIVFQDSKKLHQLEAIIHPAVLQKIDEEYAKASGNCFVVEIPLLYEIGAEENYDFVIAILCDEAQKRFASGEKEYALRMKRQLRPEEKSAKADYTILNNGTLNELREKVIQLHHTILRGSSRGNTQP